MWNKEKIMRQAERALKRTVAYREKRSDSHDPEDNFQLAYVVAKGSKSTPETAIAYAYYLDEILLFNPFEGNSDAKLIGDWAFNFDGALFMYLEQGYMLVGASALTHSLVWGEIEECHGNGSINFPKGMQQYLYYCKQNGVTVSLLRKEQGYSGMDVMKLYDKSAFKEKPAQERAR